MGRPAVTTGSTSRAARQSIRVTFDHRRCARAELQLWRLDRFPRQRATYPAAQLRERRPDAGVEIDEPDVGSDKLELTAVGQCRPYEVAVDFDDIGLMHGRIPRPICPRYLQPDPMGTRETFRRLTARNQASLPLPVPQNSRNRHTINSPEIMARAIT